MLKTAAALMLTAGLAACAGYAPDPYAHTASQVPTSVMLPPLAPNLSSPPPFNPDATARPAIPATALPLAPPEVIGAPAPETMPMPQ